MSDSNQPPPGDAAKREQLSKDFLDLCNDFDKFSDECAFLCDAFAALAQDPESITPPTGDGIGHVSYWLKCQVLDYREKIDELRKCWNALNRDQ
ncbi:hypothetical protein SG34_015145 [Thalassomonas viridans]|uniref:Uncharacterized protein n=1 Tax=Thalassomonas viridans TaxID=137584 RepID=A0AAE9YYJ2_9GAMM|nr:hypothetical protein [Thalassomonas viridans]WDE02780.1 hypothetical protein SG34_015145 [Thalassomonas viridans]